MIDVVAFNATLSAWQKVGITREDVDSVIVHQQDSNDGVTLRTLPIHELKKGVKLGDTFG